MAGDFMIEDIFQPKLSEILPPSVLADEKLKASVKLCTCRDLMS